MCACVRLRALRIVSRNKSLRFKNIFLLFIIFIIIIIIVLQSETCGRAHNEKVHLVRSDAHALYYSELHNAGKVRCSLALSVPTLATIVHKDYEIIALVVLFSLRLFGLGRSEAVIPECKSLSGV